MLGNLFTITLGWVASGVAAVTFAGALGVAPEQLHRVAFAWAAVALLGSLVVDEVRDGARTTGQVVRRSALWPPFVLGAVTALLALAPIVTETATEAGWTLLAAAALAFATAVPAAPGRRVDHRLDRLAAAAVLLSPWDLSHHPVAPRASPPGCSWPPRWPTT